VYPYDLIIFGMTSSHSPYFPSILFLIGQFEEENRSIKTVSEPFLCHFIGNVNYLAWRPPRKLQKAFQEMDEFTLKDFETEWRTARQRMLNLKFGF